MMEASQQEEKRGITHADLDRAAEAALADESEAVEEVEEETEAIAADEVVEESEEPEEEETGEEPETALETESEEEAVPQETKAKDEENAERSRLGRKVKTLEDQLTRLVSLLESKETAKDEPADEEEEGDAYITPENLPKYIARETQKQEAEQKKYQQSYVGNFSQLGKDDDNFTEIWEEMLANYNSIVTGDPKADAQINYYKARAAIFENRKPVNPVQGKSKTSKTKVNVPDKIQTKAPKPVKLDPIAAEFVKRQKLSTEFVEKTLNK